MSKTFAVGGVSKSKSGYKVRFAADMTRVKILAKTDTDVQLMELPRAMTKPELVTFLKTSDLYANADYRAAIDAFNDAILLDPGNDSAFLMRAESYQQLTDLPSAEADFNESLRLQPNNSRAYLGRANVRAAQGKLPEALADVAEAVTRDPQNTQGYLTREIGRAHV